MTTTALPSDLEIARSVTPRPILEVARELGLRDDEIEPYGSTKAKVTLAENANRADHLQCVVVEDLDAVVVAVFGDVNVSGSVEGDIGGIDKQAGFTAQRAPILQKLAGG